MKNSNVSLWKKYIIFKKCSQRNQNPSRYYYNSIITNLKKISINLPSTGKFCFPPGQFFPITEMSALFQSLQCRFFQPIGYCSSSHLPSSGKAPVKGPPLFWPVLGGYHFFLISAGSGYQKQFPYMLGSLNIIFKLFFRRRIQVSNLDYFFPQDQFLSLQFLPMWEQSIIYIRYHF